MSNSTPDNLFIISLAHIVAHTSAVTSSFDRHILHLPDFFKIRNVDIQPSRADIGADCSSQRATD